MIDIDRLYFEWLLKHLDTEEEDSAIGLPKLCWVLFHLVFTRRVGLDENRAEGGLALRRRFLEDYGELHIPPRLTNPFLTEEQCSWLEMLVRLCEDLDFMYDGGVRGWFIELVTNAHLEAILWSSDEDISDQEADYVESVMNDINESRFDPNGVGGLFPLSKSGHPDQRRAEIWAQSSAYLGERLEGVLWTSTD